VGGLVHSKLFFASLWFFDGIVFDISWVYLNTLWLSGNCVRLLIGAFGVAYEGYERLDGEDSKP
jgi:hypothetical protein